MENDQEQTNNIDTSKMRYPGESTADTALDASAPRAAAPTAEKSFPFGPVIAGLIILLVLILGGLYLWGVMLATDTEDTDEPVETATAEEERSPSEDLNQIDAALDTETFTEFESDLETIDSEMEGGATTTTGTTTQ